MPHPQKLKKGGGKEVKSVGNEQSCHDFFSSPTHRFIFQQKEL